MKEQNRLNMIIDGANFYYRQLNNNVNALEQEIHEIEAKLKDDNILKKDDILFQKELEYKKNKLLELKGEKKGALNTREIILNGG